MTGRIVIAGGGVAGLTLALALARGFGDGSSILLADPALAQAERPSDRAYAISPGARRMFAALGVWDQLAGAVEPIRRMEVTDSRAHDVVRPIYLSFDEAGDGEPLAHMAWSRAISLALIAAAREAGVGLETARVLGADREGPLAALRLEGADRRLEATLLAAADGRGSRLREEAGIGWVGWDYHQSGIVATIAHERPHGGVAHEHFLPAGPFAVLPMPDDAQGGHRSSIVWTEATRDAETMVSLPPDDLLEELERRFGHRLGEIRFASAARAYPLTFGVARRFVDRRLALLGDAAHAVHPIAGQGLNLGLKGVAALAQTIVDAARLGLDIGSPEALAGYERAHRADTVAMGAMTDGLNRLFSTDATPVRLARGLGLGLVDRMEPLKRFFVGEASGLGGPAPRLLRGEAI